jgi:hypothetical protein
MQEDKILLPKDDESCVHKFWNFGRGEEEAPEGSCFVLQEETSVTKNRTNTCVYGRVDPDVQPS